MFHRAVQLVSSGSAGARKAASRVTSSLLASTLLLVATMPAYASDTWPEAVNARYKLKFQGIEVGKLDFHSQTSPQGYTINGGAQLSVLLGLFKIKTAGNATGAIAGGGAAAAPQPKTYAFDWQGGKKHGAIKLGFEGGAAKHISVDPPPSPSPETIPLLDKHKANVVDPISAIMVLTRNDGKPCDKRVPVFDGKHRFDVVFSFKRQQPIKPAGGSKVASGEVGIVCAVTYVPIAGHKQKAETEAFAKNRDMEVLLRRLPGSDMMVPHTVTIPTAWGTATMVSDRIDVTSSKAGQIALRD